MWLFFYRLFYPPLLLIAFFLMPLNKKLRRGLLGRLNRKTALYQNAIWFHCSSGEFEYAKPVLKELKAKYPERKTLVTYFSPSVAYSVENSPFVDDSCYMPFDLAFSWSVFFKKYRPKMLLIARTDFWPEMLQQCKKHKLESLLFSATLSDSSPRLQKSIHRSFSKILLSNITEIFCVSAADKKNFQVLAPKVKVSVQGDSRYDQVLERLKNARIFSQLNTKKSIFIYGSTWPEDEKITANFIAKTAGEIAHIIVPHEIEPSHIKEIRNLLQTNNIDSQIWSEQKNWDSSKVMIVDQVGLLAELYPIAKWAFVGGSFRKSIHSVMEALAAGCQVYFGPYYKNNREAIEFLNQNKGYAICVQNAENWHQEWIKHILLDPNFAQNLKKQIHEKSGSSKFILNWIDARH